MGNVWVFNAVVIYACVEFDGDIRVVPLQLQGIHQVKRVYGDFMTWCMHPYFTVPCYLRYMYLQLDTNILGTWHLAVDAHGFYNVNLCSFREVA